MRSLSDRLQEMDEIHSKVGAVRRMARERIKRDPESRIIVFANYRDTVEALEKALDGLEGSRQSSSLGSRVGQDREA